MIQLNTMAYIAISQQLLSMGVVVLHWMGLLVNIMRFAVYTRTTFSSPSIIRNSIIRNNAVDGFSMIDDVKYKSTASSTTTIRITLENVAIYNNGRHGFVGSVFSCSDVTINNSSIFGNKYGVSFLLREVIPASAQNLNCLSLTNSIIYGNTTADLYTDDDDESAGDGIAQTTNLCGVIDDGDTSIMGTCAFTSDPLLNSDGTLQANSPAIEAGTGNDVTTDLLGNTRVGAYDIGAYEYQWDGISHYYSDTGTGRGFTPSTPDAILDIDVSVRSIGDINYLMPDGFSGSLPSVSAKADGAVFALCTSLSSVWALKDTDDCSDENRCYIDKSFLDQWPDLPGGEAQYWFPSGF